VSEPALAIRPRVTPLALIVWLGATVLGTICGIGGGIFGVPLLHYGCKLPIKLAVGTSAVLVLVMTITATGVEIFHGRSSLDWVVVGLLLFGSIPGAQFGYAFSRRADAKLLKKLFVFLLVIAAVRTATLSAGAVVHVHEDDMPLTLAQSLLVVVIGFGGGFLAPLLGVGGGILVIPALFLLLPQIGYLDARACSMAMSVVNSAQSVWLFMRDRGVDLKTAKPFAAIAVLGAIGGTFLVHLDGWADVARICMTIVLLVVAARFAWDVWSAARAARLPAPD
jgi:uncharacterized membrane protein YfcA